MTIDNATQIKFWNGETGRNWVTHDALMEAMLQPVGESVMDTLALQPGEHVLDIGCGCAVSSAYRLYWKTALLRPSGLA